MRDSVWHAHARNGARPDRWFQYGMTCPLFRQHGQRDYTAPWYYGDEALGIITSVIRLRYALRDYILAEIHRTSDVGMPLNRPLFWDFPADRAAWDIDDQYMFGSDYMVAPILDAGARNRTVYFPKGARWIHHYTGETYEGGKQALVPAPLKTFPLFRRSAYR